MPHLLLVFFLFFISLLDAKTTIDSKIKKTNSKLNNYEKKYKNAHKRLAKSAKEILQKQKELYKLDRDLAKIEEDLNDKKDRYDATKDTIASLQNNKDALTKTKEKMRKELSRLMAKQLSLQIITQQEAFHDTDALIRSEVFTAISRLTKQELKKIKSEIGIVLTNEDALSKKINGLSKNISSIDTKRKNLIQAKNSQKKALESLNNKRNLYKKDLEKTLSTKADLRKALQKLKIIKDDQIKASQREKEERQRQAHLKNSKDSKGINNIKVKHGDLYEKVKVRKYRGKKTIAPLASYKVVKKFGRYKDPIYGIKIFNESISLKPTHSNATVRAVLNGKVILSKKTPLLGYFVIIEHKNGLHTIYAHLDKIAPTLKQGKRIRKGNAIGRVNDELMFEVTQKSYHINPLQLIK